MEWYTLEVCGGKEFVVLETLDQRIKRARLEDLVEEIFIPELEEVKIIGGKRITKTKRKYPGYMFIKMKYDPELVNLVRWSPNVKGFIGGSSPTIVSYNDIGKAKEEQKNVIKKSVFKVKDKVKLITGPFVGFSGNVVEVLPNKNRVKILVSVFGRDVPVEVDEKDLEKVGG